MHFVSVTKKIIKMKQNFSYFYVILYFDALKRVTRGFPTPSIPLFFPFNAFSMQSTKNFHLHVF